MRWIAVVCTAALFSSSTKAFFQTQQPIPPPPSAATVGQTPATIPNNPAKTNHGHANDFLIRGTVFNDKALSFPGVQLRIRRVGEKKFRWEIYTNSRGEFAVRVPQGSEYEMVVRAKGFVEQKRTIDAKSGDNEETIAFRLEPATGGKK
jgi:hypothetical protein